MTEKATTTGSAVYIISGTVPIAKEINCGRKIINKKQQIRYCFSITNTVFTLGIETENWGLQSNVKVRANTPCKQTL